MLKGEKKLIFIKNKMIPGPALREKIFPLFMPQWRSLNILHYTGYRALRAFSSKAMFEKMYNNADKFLINRQ